MIEDPQEYLQVWEKENNPFYPNEMRWDRVKVNLFLKDWKKQRSTPDDTCLFDRAWIGKCGKDAKDGLCEEHKEVKCCSCGEQAVKECSETGSLVCGAPLCEDCEHTVRSNGCNSGGDLPAGLKGHCKKSEQVYMPWYMNENNNTPDSGGGFNGIGQMCKKCSGDGWVLYSKGGQSGLIKDCPKCDGKGVIKN